MLSILSLESMEFYAYHGCFKEENIIGGHFQVNLDLEFNSEVAEESDQIQDTINYPEVYQIVKTQMMINSKLIEHVARRIIDAIKDKFPVVEHVQVKISKMNPPIGEKINNVSILIKR